MLYLEEPFLAVREPLLLSFTTRLQAYFLSL